MITQETYLAIRAQLTKDAKTCVRVCRAWRGENDFYNFGEGFCRERMTENLNEAAHLRHLIMRLDTEINHINQKGKETK